MNEKSKAAICTDEIEAAVYAQLKPLGFRKYGRTLHRFVSGDLSQVIHFQCGLPSAGPAQQMWVNLASAYRSATSAPFPHRHQNGITANTTAPCAPVSGALTAGRSYALTCESSRHSS